MYSTSYPGPLRGSEAKALGTRLGCTLLISLSNFTQKLESLCKVRCFTHFESKHSGVFCSAVFGFRNCKFSTFFQKLFLFIHILNSKLSYILRNLFLFYYSVFLTASYVFIGQRFPRVGFKVNKMSKMKVIRSAVQSERIIVSHLKNPPGESGRHQHTIYERFVIG